MKNRKLIIISGMPHSGTRLVFEIIKKKNFFNLKKKLNYVNEFPSLHQAYINKINKKKRDLILNFSVLKKILNKYISYTNSKNIVIKLPYYPIIDWKNYHKYSKLYKFDLEFIISRRKFDNIFESFQNRNEDLKYGKDQIYKIPNYIKIKKNQDFRYYLFYQQKVMNQILANIKKKKIIIKYYTLNKIKFSNKNSFGYSKKRFNENKKNLFNSVFRFIERLILYLQKIK